MVDLQKKLGSVPVRCGSRWPITWEDVCASGIIFSGDFEIKRSRLRRLAPNASLRSFFGMGGRNHAIQIACPIFVAPFTELVVEKDGYQDRIAC